MSNTPRLLIIESSRSGHATALAPLLRELSESPMIASLILLPPPPQPTLSTPPPLVTPSPVNSPVPRYPVSYPAPSPASAGARCNPYPQTPLRMALRYGVGLPPIVPNHVRCRCHRDNHARRML